jgi:class 3 adenylate cyclase
VQPAASGHASGSRRFWRALSTPTEWSPVDKTLLAAAIVLPQLCGSSVVGAYVIAHPDVAPYFDRPFAIGVALWTGNHVIIPAWIAVILVGLVLRRRDPANTVFVHAAIVLYFAWNGCLAYFFGSHTTLFAGLSLLGGAAYGFLMFGRGPTYRGIAVWVAIVLTTSIAEQAGHLPYAPMFREAPWQNHRLSTAWFVAPGATDLVSMLVILVVLDFITTRWRAHEVELARTSDQLARANQFISRYVASQLAEQIRAGDMAALERHERRPMTLFFSDIKDFTDATERLEPEDLSAMLNEYLSEMSVIADRYGATIDKFVGDAIMIFFGAPTRTAEPDQALRAVRMALDMQRRIAELGVAWLARLGRPLEVRMGINTGQASVGNFGSQGRADYTAIGRQVNLAARLQAACTPGRILVSRTTWLLVRDDIEATPMGTIDVKGVRDPVEVYEVVADRGRIPADGRTAIVS